MSACFALQIVQSASLLILNLCFSFRPGISHLLGLDPVTDVPPARASCCSSACHQLDKALVRIMYLRLHTAASICHALRSRLPAAQRETAFLNLADDNGSDEAVRSDRRDSRGLPETCERRDWRIRDPTWRKRDPIWRKSGEIGEKVNFVGEIFFIHAGPSRQSQSFRGREGRLTSLFCSGL